MNESTFGPVNTVGGPVGEPIELMPLTRELMDRIAPPGSATSVPGLEPPPGVAQAFNETLRRFGYDPRRYPLEYDARPLQAQRAEWTAALERVREFKRARADRTVIWQRVRGGRATHAFAPGADAPLCGVAPVRGPGDTPSVWREPPGLWESGYRFRSPIRPVGGRALHPHSRCSRIVERDGWFTR